MFISLWEMEDGTIDKLYVNSYPCGSENKKEETIYIKK